MSVLYRSMIIALALAFMSCTSPLELDVDRDATFIDGSTHPKRVSVYYHFADSAYEAIIIDPTWLETVWIERAPVPGGNADTYRYSISIPQLVFEVPQTVRPSKERPVMVHRFSLSCRQQPADGQFRYCINPSSWIQGLIFDERGGDPEPFQWLADERGRQLRLAFFAVPQQRIMKGSIQLALVEPRGQRYSTYRALITMEY